MDCCITVGAHEVGACTTAFQALTRGRVLIEALKPWRAEKKKKNQVHEHEDAPGFEPLSRPSHPVLVNRCVDVTGISEALSFVRVILELGEGLDDDLIVIPSRSNDTLFY